MRSPRSSKLERIRRLLSVVAPTLAVSGCSLSGFDDFDIPDCKENVDCAPLNEREGIGADACQVYQCRKAGVGCELRARDMDDDGYLDRVCAGSADLAGSGDFDCDDENAAAHAGGKETCDGVDNDCNGIIDDGVAPELKRTATLGLIGKGLSVVFGDAEGSAPRVTVSNETGSARTSLVRSDTPDTPAPSLAFTYLSAQNQPDTDDGSSKCPNPGGTQTACSFAEAALTAFGRPPTSDDSGTRAIVAAVNRSGCAHGQVRIGYLRGATDVVLHGPEVHSNLFEGVDLTDDGCTGASRSAGPVGATLINTAGLAGTASRFPQALSVWLADSSSERTDCGGAEVMVEAVGSWLEKSANRDDVYWTNGTNDGVPETLGATRGDGRPAVVAIDSGDVSGYFVAYGASGGGIALHFLPRFDEPPEYDFSASEPRVTAPLGAAISLVFAEGAAADQVSLSVTSVADSEVELAVTWLEGECAEARSVYFEQLTVDVGEGTLDERASLLVAKDAARLAATAVAVKSGLLTAEFELDERKARDTGGHLVAWTSTSGTLKLARISSFTGNVVGKVMDMGSAVVGAPLLFDDGGPALAMYSDAGEVFSGPALCE